MKEVAHTRITGKEYSPLIIRRYSTRELGILFVGIITDENLDSLDSVVNRFLKSKVTPIRIQEARNLTGELCEALLGTYKKTEGLGIIAYFDKMTIASLFKDMMSHEMCRIELYSLLNFMTKV